jgi:pimeloyl-ACP methyl ester carboxylesterase
MRDLLVNHRYIQSTGAQLHCVEAGAGSPVVLLHGIPESWRAWQHLIPVIANSGFRPIAPDLRGYGLSDKPQSVAAYRADLLAEDVEAVVLASGSRCAAVVGHSWGALAAWLFAMRHPDMLNRLVIMNIPHPLRWVEALRTWRFWLRSPQMAFFQLPIVPELLLGIRDSAVLRRSLTRDLGGAGGFEANEIGDLIRDMSRPGALTGALNYYRAFLRANPFRLGWTLGVIDAPVLVIWGAQDRYFPVDLAQPPDSWVPNVRVEVLQGAGHWPHRNRPNDVSNLVLDFLRT